MNRPTLALGLVVAASAAGLAGEREASACGGCFHPPTQTASDITDERMLLTVSTTQTTLYDQLRYVGSPSSFAWVLPTHGTVTVGLSADVLFNSMDELTATTIRPPPVSCPGPTNCRVAAPQASGAASNATEDAGAALVTVTNQENVGPYATVQLHSTDPTALNDWLSQNGYVIPDTVTPIIDEYVTEGFDFLAMKLLPNQGVQAMRPVRVTMPGASLSLPLRMAAVGTGASVGITIWVVADGRYEPQNFPFFHIDDSDLVWDFGMNLSNYTTLRVQDEANLGNKGWEIESSIALNEQLITNVIMSGGQYYGGNGGFGSGYVSDPTKDYLPVGDPDAGTDGDGGGGTDGGTVAQTAEEVRAADIATLFTGLTGPSVRVTRIRSDIIHSAMTVDFLLQASADQSELSNIRNVTQSVNLTCPIYNGCAQVGSAPYSADGGAATSSQSGSGSSSGSIGDADAGLGVTLGGSSGSSSGGSGSGGATGNGASASSGSGGGGCAASARPSPTAPAALASLFGLALLTGLRWRKAAKRDPRPGSRSGGNDAS